MTVTIELNHDDAARLSAAAQRNGLGLDEFAKKLVTESLPPSNGILPNAENQALIDLLHAWKEEDATDDPEELALRDAETTTLLNNIKCSRVSFGVPDL